VRADGAAEAGDVGLDQLPLRVAGRYCRAAGRAGLDLADELVHQRVGLRNTSQQQGGDEGERLDGNPRVSAA